MICAFALMISQNTPFFLKIVIYLSQVSFTEKWCDLFLCKIISDVKITCREETSNQRSLLTKPEDKC